MSDIDLLAQRQIDGEAQGQAAVAPVELEDPVDLQARNMAMQLAMQKYPDASIDELKTYAVEFENYLTEHN